MAKSGRKSAWSERQRDHVRLDERTKRRIDRAQINDVRFVGQVRLRQRFGDIAHHIGMERLFSIDGKIEVGITPHRSCRAGPEDPSACARRKVGAEDRPDDRQFALRQIDRPGQAKRRCSSSRKYSASARKPGMASATS
jgi:hypothetical protein